MTQVVVAVGSNYEREKNICAGLDELTKYFGVLLISPVYESAARCGGDNYYNLIVAFSSDLSSVQIKNRLRDIENQQQRQRNIEQVTLDLDLLLYGEECGDSEGLQLPHADIDHCDYVLRPLADLLPNQIHPVKQQNFQQLWDEFPKQELLMPVDFVWRQQVISISAPLLI